MAALESEDWFNRQRKELFASTIAGVAVVYSGFVVYAVSHVIHQHEGRAYLERAYIESDKLVNYPQSTLMKPDNSPDPDLIKDFSLKIQKWSVATADWLRVNVSEAASERFLDMSDVPRFGFSYWPLIDEAVRPAAILRHISAP